jgi:hypothetical protein
MPIISDWEVIMFCKRKYIVDPTNKEHVKRMNALLLQRKYQFVVGEGNDVLKGWCGEVTVDEHSFLILSEVILDMSKQVKQREYQEHSELRFFNTPFAAFVNETNGGVEEAVPVQGGSDYYQVW